VASAAAMDDFERDAYRSELDMSRREMARDAASVSEQKQFEYQTAKTLTDMNGNRVRMEQYISRPQADQTRVYSYNGRDNRVDTGLALSTYNRELPADLTDIARQNHLNPTWYITDQSARMENSMGDYAEHFLSGGKLYKTADTPDGGTFALLYDNDKTTISGKTKIDVVRQASDASRNVQGYTEYWFPDAAGNLAKSFDSRFDITHPVQTWGYVYNAAIYPNPTHTPTAAEVIAKLMAGEAIDLNAMTTFHFADGTTLSVQKAWITDTGDIVNTANLKDTAQRQDWDTVSQWNTEIIITASEWGGRNLDLIWSPQNFLSQMVSASPSTLAQN
ncbi:MAG: hypothetical protein ACYC5N_03175, partial [Endomicrobiales bacterium]